MRSFVESDSDNDEEKNDDDWNSPSPHGHSSKPDLLPPPPPAGGPPPPPPREFFIYNFYLFSIIYHSAPPPGIAPPVKKFERGSSSTEVASESVAKKPNPVDIGAKGPNLFALAAGAAALKSIKPVEVKPIPATTAEVKPNPIIPEKSAEVEPSPVPSTPSSNVFSSKPFEPIASDTLPAFNNFNNNLGSTSPFKVNPPLFAGQINDPVPSPFTSNPFPLTQEAPSTEPVKTSRPKPPPPPPSKKNTITQPVKEKTDSGESDGWEVVNKEESPIQMVVVEKNSTDFDFIQPPDPDFNPFARVPQSIRDNNRPVSDLFSDDKMSFPPGKSTSIHEVHFPRDIFNNHSLIVASEIFAPPTSEPFTTLKEPERTRTPESPDEIFVPPILFSVKCTYDFEPNRPDDIVMTKDDILHIEREDGDWLFGVNETSKSKGWFPRNFVEVFDPYKSPEIVLPISKGKILYEYTAVRDDELTVVIGEVVSIYDKSGDWWKVENASGRTGVIPAMYIKELSDGEDDGGGVDVPVRSTSLSTGMDGGNPSLFDTSSEYANPPRRVSQNQ
jgi:hypothetical protein